MKKNKTYTHTHRQAEIDLEEIQDRGFLVSHWRHAGKIYVDKDGRIWAAVDGNNR